MASNVTSTPKAGAKPAAPVQKTKVTQPTPPAQPKPAATPAKPQGVAASAAALGLPTSALPKPPAAVTKPIPTPVQDIVTAAGARDVTGTPAIANQFNTTILPNLPQPVPTTPTTSATTTDPVVELMKQQAEAARQSAFALLQDTFNQYGLGELAGTTEAYADEHERRGSNPSS